MIELADLEKLVAVYEQRTLSAAAKSLHVSQPALTRAMQKLEAAFGCPLFSRSKNKVELNEAGVLAVTEAKKVLSAERHLKERMAEYVQSQRSVTVGACAPGPMWMLAETLRTLLPETEVHEKLVDENKLLDGLLSNQYQYIITTERVREKGIVSKELVTEHLSVAFPAMHPLAEKTDGIYLKDLAGQTMLLFSDLGVWQRLCDKQTDIRFIVQSDMNAFVDLTNLSFLPHFVTNLSVREDSSAGRVLVPLLDSEASIPFYVSYLKKHKHLPRELI